LTGDGPESAQYSLVCKDFEAADRIEDFCAQFPKTNFCRPPLPPTRERACAV